ncbi:MAG: YceI family protein [Gemmatimonadales bacterium]
MRPSPVWLAALTLALAGRASAQDGPDSTVYRLLPASRLEVRTGRAGLFKGLGHEHLVRARAFQGTIVYVPAAPERSSVAIRVAVDSLEIRTDADSSDVAKMTRAMREQTLKVEEYPEITFVSREVAPVEGGVRVTGEFTLARRTRPLVVDVALTLAGDTLRATAAFRLKQTDFGIKPYSAGFGTVKVADEVRFALDVVAAPAPVR